MLFSLLAILVVLTTSSLFFVDASDRCHGNDVALQRSPCYTKFGCAGVGPRECGGYEIVDGKYYQCGVTTGISDCNTNAASCICGAGYEVCGRTHECHLYHAETVEETKKNLRAD